MKYEFTTEQAELLSSIEEHLYSADGKYYIDFSVIKDQIGSIEFESVMINAFQHEIPVNLELLNIEDGILFKVDNHGYEVGTHFAAYIDAEGIKPAKAISKNEEAFGLVVVVDETYLNYIPNSGYIYKTEHSYEKGKILYLQDDGSLGYEVGTNVQKIFDVVDEGNLIWIGHPMYANTGFTSTGIVVVKMSSANANSTTSAIVSLDELVHSNIESAAIQDNILSLPMGTYTISVDASIDNNSARQNLIWELYRNGILDSTKYGGSYARIASGHNQTGDHMSFFIDSKYENFTLNLATKREAGGGTNTFNATLIVHKHS